MAATDCRTILLVRHGETDWNRIGRWQGATDIPLSDVGRAQARALAQRLANLGIGAVHASHLARARETAEIVVATLALPSPVIVDSRLGERGYGCFEGLTREECATRHPEAWARYVEDRRAVPPDAEPQAEVIARMTAGMVAIATAKIPGRNASEGEGEGKGEDEGRAELFAHAPPTLVISHGGSIRAFVHAATGIALRPLENGGLVRLDYAQGRFVLVGDVNVFAAV